MSILLFSFSIAMVLTIWFKTEAFEEYFTLLNKIHNVFSLSSYRMLKGNDPSVTFHDYLNTYHNNFFIRLITCPVCLGTWFGLATIPWTGWSCLAVTFLGLLSYMLLAKLMGNA